MARKEKKTFETESKPFPSRLRQLMQERGYTQQQLANELSGMQRSTIAGYVTGQSSPDFERLVQIADFFNVSTDYLLGRTEIQSANIEKRAISDYTGLPEEVVSRLKTCKRGGWNKVLAAALNDSFFAMLIGINGMCNQGEKLIKLANNFPISAEILENDPYFDEIVQFYDNSFDEDLKKGMNPNREKYEIEKWENCVLPELENLELSEYRLSKDLRAWAEDICHSTELLRTVNDIHSKLEERYFRIIEEE